MWRVSFLVAPVLASALLPIPAAAQNLRKAPEEVEKALLARVDRFYTAFKEHRFRQAEALVAEESRDQFYNMQKAPIFGYKVENIDWDDSFHTALVLVTCRVNTPRAGPNGMPVPVTGKWQLIDGEWYLVIKPTNVSPFGPMSFDLSAPPQEKPPQTGDRPTLESIAAGAIKVEPEKLVISREGDGVVTQSVVITNNLPGALDVAIEAPDLPGLKLVNAGKSIAAKSQMTFQVVYDQKLGRIQPQCQSCKPSLSGNWDVLIRVQPINQTAKVALEFK
jgi:hypothetical protein